jgi:hypothetical protein
MASVLDLANAGGIVVVLDELAKEAEDALLFEREVFGHTPLLYVSELLFCRTSILAGRRVVNPHRPQYNLLYRNDGRKALCRRARAEVISLRVSMP